MNKLVKNFVSTLVLAAILSWVLPWWSVMLAAIISSYIFPLKKIAVFVIPFLAVLLFWCMYCYLLSSSNNFILAKKIASLLPFQGNPYVLILATGVIGGFAAGISAIFGNQLRQIGR